MLYNQRNLPHPVLSPVSQDYREQFKFEGKIANVREDGENRRIVIAIQYQLQEPTLELLIQEGRARFTTRMDCPAGRSRESHSTAGATQEITLDARRYAGDIQIQSFITASEEIRKFHSSSWTPELAGFLKEGITVPEGAILAMDDPGNVSVEEVEPLESCVVIIPSENIEEGTFDVRLEDEHIAIIVNHLDKARVDRTRHGSNEPYLWPSMYLTAIEMALREHGNDDYREKTWAKVIREQVSRAGIDTSDEQAFQARSLLHAQKLLENPMRHLITEEEQDE